MKDWNDMQEIRHKGVNVKLKNDVDFSYLLEGDTLKIYCHESSDPRKNLTDWLTNIFIIPTFHHGIIYHKGFYDSAMDIIKELDLKDYKIKLYGYSLGGAIATIINDNIGGELVTFGEPMNAIIVRNKKVKLSRKKAKRYVQGDDIVTWLMPFYRHYSNKIKLKSMGNCFVNHNYYQLGE